MSSSAVEVLEQIVQDKMNSSGTVQDKLKFLSSLKEICINICNEAKSKLLDSYTYCKDCDQYYRNETWKVETRVEEGTYVQQPLAEFDDPSVCSCLYKVTTKTCPVGHIVLDQEVC